MEHSHESGIHGKPSTVSRWPALLLAWARLVRLPNVFTAPADILLGFWVATRNSSSAVTVELLALIVASCALYAAGMVYNDLFDLAKDLVERPERPLPSGALSRRFAIGFAVLLSCLGVISALWAGPVSGVIAIALLAAILGYDGWLKGTVAGPPTMGFCRLLNVLLGASPALGLDLLDSPGWLAEPLWLIPLANGMYITGVTWFARQEAATSRRSRLVAAVLVMITALFGHTLALADAPRTDLLSWGIGTLLLLLLTYRWVQAIIMPLPKQVQQAVKAMVLGLIVIDGVLVLGFCGAVPGLVVLILLVPAIVLGRWLYST